MISKQSGDKINLLLGTVKGVLAKEGLAGFALRSPKRLFKYLKHAFSAASFEFDGRRYKYFSSLFNFTFRSERAVEIPIALDYAQRFRGREILEVGNVLNHYAKFRHDVLDKYEKDDGVINRDIVEYAPGKKYDLIISISTLEHIGYDEEPRDENKVLAAMKSMEDLLSEGGLILITFPWGYNKGLDAFFEEGRLNFTKSFFLKRLTKDNRWGEAAFSGIKQSAFNSPYPYANAVVIGEVRR